MNISCNNCGKVHSVPDDIISNKKVYFFCSSCRHKIIVDSRTKITEKTGDILSLANFTDIFNGLFSFFNWPGLLISMLQIIVSVLILGICGQLFYKNITFFAQNIEVAVFLAFCIGLLIIYTRSLTLYYISKVQFFHFHHPEKKHIDWKSIHFDLEEDWITLLFYTCAALMVLFLIIVPLPYLRSFSIFYAGIFFPVFFAATLLIILAVILFRFLPAILSAGSFFVKDGIKEVYSFVIREYAQMPFYWIVITVITKFFGFLFFGIYSAVMFLSGTVIFTFMSGEGKNSLMHFFRSLPNVRSARDSIPSYVSLGAVILLIMIFLSMVLFFAFMDNFIQSLYVKSVSVMNKNPKESFNRYAVFVILALIILFSLLGVMVLINTATPQLPVFLQKFVTV